MKAIMLCTRVVLMHGNPPPGSRRERCERCKSVVWVSPASERQATKMAEGGTVSFVCTICIPVLSVDVQLPSAAVFEEAVRGCDGERAQVAAVVEVLTGKRPEDA